jgi:hypothetical protein
LRQLHRNKHTQKYKENFPKFLSEPLLYSVTVSEQQKDKYTPKYKGIPSNILYLT